MVSQKEKRKSSLKNSLQEYNGNGISKVIPPTRTLSIILEKIKKISPPILEKYLEIKKKTKIPQYYVLGTDHYATVVNRIGRHSYTRSSNGKGYKKTHALVSGLVEMAERYSCNKHFIFDPLKTKVMEFGKIKDNLYGEKEFFSNPVFRKKFDILDRKTLNSARLIWHKGYSINGEESLLPVSIITYMHEITNGMAAGNTLEEALLHGICEVIERHCKSVIRDNEITPPTISQKTVKYRVVNSLLAKFRASGYSITLKDYSMDLGIPVVAAIRKVDRDHCVVTVGVAPHPEEAMSRALTENSQAEKPRKISYFKHLFGKSKTIDAKSLPNVYDRSIKTELILVDELLSRKGMKIWYVDTTDEVMKVPSVFVHISNTRRNNVNLTYRNIIIGLIEESLKMMDLPQARKFTKLGQKKDKKNHNIYSYYDGVVEAKNGSFEKAIQSFSVIKKLESLYEMRTFLYIQTALSYFLMGNMDKMVSFFAKNIREFPGMNPVYLRGHHFFINPKSVPALKKVYDELQAIATNIDIHTLRFQKQFAKRLNLYKL